MRECQGDWRAAISYRAAVVAERPVTLSLQQARLLHLAAQGLLARPRRRARKSDVLAAIAAMQLLQIDTIHVVARSPYLVLFSRLGAYDPLWLDALLDEAAIFECWAHEACFAATRDLALHRACLADRAHHWSMKHAQRTQLAQRASMDQLLEHVRRFGPVKAADFERTTKAASSWWGWKDEKRWLEACFALGELMVTRRDSFHRGVRPGRAGARQGHAGVRGRPAGPRGRAPRPRRAVGSGAGADAGALDLRLLPDAAQAPGRRPRALRRGGRAVARHGARLGRARLRAS